MNSPSQLALCASDPGSLPPIPLLFPYKQNPRVKMAAADAPKQSALQTLRNWGGMLLMLVPIRLQCALTCQPHVDSNSCRQTYLHDDRELCSSNTAGHAHHSTTCSPVPAHAHALPTTPALLVLLEPERLPIRCCRYHSSLEWTVCAFSHKAEPGKRLFILLGPNFAKLHVIRASRTSSLQGA